MLKRFAAILTQAVPMLAAATESGDNVLVDMFNKRGNKASADNEH